MSRRSQNGHSVGFVAMRLRTTPRAPKALATAALLLVVVIWGSTFVATKLLFEQIGPVQLALARFIIAAAILIPLVDWRASRPLPWGRLAVLGLTGVTAFFLFQNIGLVYSSATATSLILGCVPAFIAASAAVFLGEKLSPRRIAGIVGSVTGVALTVAGGRSDASSPNPVLGGALILGAAVAWTIYTSIGKGLDRLPFQVITAASVGFGALFLLPFGVLETLWRGWPTLTIEGWLGVLYLGAGASAAAYYLWNYGLRQLDASEAGVYINLVPLVGVVLAAVAIRETVGPFEMVGGALIIAGVAVARRASGTSSPVEADNVSSKAASD